MITIDGKEHDPETFEGEAKVHYEQVVAIREQLGQISNQIGQLQQAGLNLQVALDGDGGGGRTLQLPECRHRP